MNKKAYTKPSISVLQFKGAQLLTSSFRAKVGTDDELFFGGLDDDELDAW